MTVIAPSDRKRRFPAEPQAIRIFGELAVRSSRPFAGMTRIRFEGFGLKPSQLAKSTPRNGGDFSGERCDGKQNR
jgi:hypothetical protein